MFDAMYIGATGMQAQQLNVDTIANNLANANTVGFKKARVGFSDLMIRDSTQLVSGMAAGQSGPLTAQTNLGVGVGIAGLTKIFDIGEMRKTESAFDVMVQGEGFIEVVLPDGGRAYTRGGTLKINRDGQLATQAGLPIKPGIAIPDGFQALTILPDGRVQVRMPNQANPVDVGQIELVRFASPQGLLAQGDNIYRASEASGEASAVWSDNQSVGTLAQGFLEGSNVKMVEEMVNLMIAQRTYEANVKVVQASDEMMAMVNGLRK